MSEPTPESTPEPEPKAEHINHFVAWFAEHIAPDVADIRIKTENTAARMEKLEALLAELAAEVHGR